MQEEDWQSLAEAVLTRRVQMGFRYATKFSEATGFQLRTYNDIENARRKSYARATLIALEEALEWESGSVSAVLSGGRPTVRAVEATHVASRPDASLLTDEELTAELNRRLARNAQDVQRNAEGT